MPLALSANEDANSSYALIVVKRILHGVQCPSESISASTALQTIVILVSISPLCGLRTSIVCIRLQVQIEQVLILDTEWQWDQLRIMKVGGNESATKFFQSNGGTAALNSKDPTTKYTSNAATKYKEELKKRSARDATEYVL
jgi:hypothetical protein